MPLGDDTALATALERALGNLGATRAVGERGRAKVVRSCNWRVVGDRIEGLYAGARLNAVAA